MLQAAGVCPISRVRDRDLDDRIGQYLNKPDKFAGRIEILNLGYYRETPRFRDGGATRLRTHPRPRCPHRRGAGGPDLREGSRKTLRSGPSAPGPPFEPKMSPLLWKFRLKA